MFPTLRRRNDEQDRKGLERALEYMALKPGTPLAEVAIDRVFIGSCTNSRIEDLRAAAKIAAGHKVSTHVSAMVVPGSQQVKAQAEKEGLDVIFKDAGFDWREPGCSMCLGMNPDILSPGERCASTSNRNFEGRQGRGGRTHLVSPEMAAAAAIAGHFVDIRNWPVHESPRGGKGLMEPFKTLTALAAPLDRTNVDTDQIIPKQFLKRIERTGYGDFLFFDWRQTPRRASPIADFVLNDPRYKGAQILIAGKNFACGSSREHAAWALSDYGFRVVIAPTFADIFFSNAGKNGIVLARLTEEEVATLLKNAQTIPNYQLTVSLEDADGDGRIADSRRRSKSIRSASSA